VTQTGSAQGLCADAVKTEMDSFDAPAFQESIFMSQIP